MSKRKTTRCRIKMPTIAPVPNLSIPPQRGQPIMMLKDCFDLARYESWKRLNKHEDDEAAG